MSIKKKKSIGICFNIGYFSRQVENKQIESADKLVKSLEEDDDKKPNPKKRKSNIPNPNSCRKSKKLKLDSTQTSHDNNIKRKRRKNKQPPSIEKSIKKVFDLK